MLKEERFTFILEKLKKEHRVHLNSLCGELGVSDDTVRRDLSELDSQGKITKVRGGAIPKTGIPLDFMERSLLISDEKQRMAEKTAKQFEKGQVVMIDGGTTNLMLAKELGKIPLTVFTNSFPIVEVLREKPLVQLHFLGGEVFHQAKVTLGAETIQEINLIKPDWLVLGVSNIHDNIGITAPDRDEGLLKRQMVLNAKSVLVMADRVKLNTAEHYKVCDISDLDILVLDDDIPFQEMEKYRTHKVKVI